MRRPPGAEGWGRRTLRGLGAAALLVAALLLPAAAGAGQLEVYEAGALPAEAAGLLVSGRDGGPLRFAALALPLPGTARLGIWIEVDGTGLLAGHDAGVLHLEIYLYALEPAGGIAGSLMKVVEIELLAAPPGESPALGADGVAFHGELALARPGELRLRLLLRNRQTGAVGLRTIPVTLAGDAAAPRILPPLVARPGDASWRRATAGDAATVLGLDPAARPLVHAGGKLPLEIHLGGLAPGAAPVLEVLGAGGEVVAEEAVRFLPGTGLAAGWRRGRAIFAARGLPMGTYHLRVRSDVPSAVSAALPVELVDAGVPASATWASLAPLARPSSTALEAPPVLRPDARLATPEPEVERAFEQALRFLIDGERATAGTLLSQVETAALAESALAIEPLVAVELGVARRLAARDTEALVPILDLYLELYREHHRQRRFLLAHHARRLSAELLALYQRRSSAEDSLSIAADFLAQLAETSRSLGDLRRALELDPDHPEVLSATATVLEQRGDYAAAVEHLERLVAIEPGDGEARLRLAVNLARVGEAARARELYARLVDPALAPAPEPWIVAVAWQEHARLELDAGHLDAAEGLVQAGLEQRPDDEKLLLLASLLLDLRRRPQAASAWLEERLPLGVHPARPAPRQLYSSPPGGRLGETRRRWQAAVRARLEVLASAIDG